MENIIKVGPYKPEVETIKQTGSTNNSETETDIDRDLIRDTAMFWAFQVLLRSNRRCPTWENSVNANIRFWVLFLLPICTWSISPKSDIVETGGSGSDVPNKHCCSRWELLDVAFCHKVITTSGIRPPTWNFWMKKASGEVGSEKLVPPINIGI